MAHRIAGFVIRRAGLRAAALAWLAFAALCAAAQAQNAHLTLLHINDVYEIAPVNGQGGLAELATLLRQERAAHKNTITTVAGDFLSPSILSGLTKGAQMIDLFNAIGVDLVSLGNHEFDFGPEILRQRIAEAKFPVVASNVSDTAGQPIAGTVDHLIKEIDGVRIGFFGIVTPSTATSSSGGVSVRFADPIPTARAEVERLRGEGADVVIALTHLDIDADLALIAAVKGIDVVLGGHDHDPITYYERGVLIHKSGSDAHFLGAIDLDIRTTNGAGGKVTTVRPAWRMLASYGVAPDPAVAAQVKTWTAKLDVELGQVIGRTAVELDSRVAAVRSGETRIGDLIADALREDLAADVAIVNGGGIRGNRVYAAGAALTRKDVLSELPFGNLAVLVELKGADLMAALENGVSKIEDHAGRFPQISGMRVAYDAKAEPLHRVRSVTIGAAPLDPNALYRVATIDFMLAGGDGYAALGKGRTLSDLRFAKLAASIVMDYVEKKKDIAPQLDGRIALQE